MTNPDNDLEMKREEEQKTLHRMAKVHDMLEMWQGSRNLRATQIESRAQTQQMTAVGLIANTEEFGNASWSNFEQDGMAAFKLSERSPGPPALSANDLPGGWTKVMDVCQIKQINCHPAERAEDSSPKPISDTENLLDWNWDLYTPIESNDDREVDDESEIELDIGVRDSETEDQRDVTTAPNVAGLIGPTQRLKNKAE